MERIKVESVSYSYQNKYQTVEAVRDVTCSFETGRLYVITGESGSGKSTFLSLLAGLDCPGSGRILVDGDDISHTDRDAYRREKVAVIYQAFHLFPLLTALEKCHVSSGDTGNAGKRSEAAGRGLSGGGRGQQEVIRTVSEDSRALRSSRGPQWRARSHPAGRSCWRTSLPAAWIRKMRKRSWISSCLWRMRGIIQSSWSRTTERSRRGRMCVWS